MFFLASLAILQHAESSAAIRSRRHAVQLAEVVNEVSIGVNSHLLCYLFHREKRCPQHLLRLAQPQVVEVLRRTRSCLLFK